MSEPIVASEAPKKHYVGKGWENKSGISISIKKDEFDKLTPVNSYGDVRLFVGRSKQPDERSGATHWVAVAQERPAGGWVPAKPPTGMPEDPVGHTPEKDLPW